MRHVILGAGPAGVVAAETLPPPRPRERDHHPRRRAGAAVLRAWRCPTFWPNTSASPAPICATATHTFEKLAIDVRQARVRSVDTSNGIVTVSYGAEIAYDRLLIATGAHPVKPPIDGIDSEGVENCWTLADARRILAGAKPGSRVVLMGAGFIGCIVLEALAARGVELIVVEMADRMLPRMMDETGGAMIARWCESKGVAVRTRDAGDGGRPYRRKAHAGDRVG